MPIMSLMLILIPLLVGNIAFFHIKSIEINTPGISTEDDLPQPRAMNDKDRVVMLQLSVTRESYLMELIDEETGAILNEANLKPDSDGLSALQKGLFTFATRFPKLDTVLITVEEDVRYDGLVSVLERSNLARLESRMPATGGGSSEVTPLKLVVVPHGGL